MSKLFLYLVDYYIYVMIKYNLDNIAFLLIVKLDSIERLENTIHTVNFLNRYFDTEIHLWEISTFSNGIIQKIIPGSVKYRFYEDLDPILHRTRYLNEMIDSVNTKYISVWDVDVVTPINQITDAVAYLKQGYDFVYPYDKFFLDTTDEIRRMYMKSDGDIDLLTEFSDFMIRLYLPNPVGGAFFANRLSYIESGKENETFYGWGFEDGERYNRWINKGYSIKKIAGPLFHLTHPRGVNSHITNPDLTLIKKRELLSSLKRTPNDGK